MNYQYNPGYTCASDQRCITLFKYLLKYYPQFIEQIAPRGFEKTPYHNMFYPTIEGEYKNYIKRRDADYRYARWQKLPCVFEPAKTFDVFKADFEFPEMDLQREMFLLYMKGIKDVFCARLLVCDKDDRRYKTHFNDTMYKAVLQVIPGAAALEKNSPFYYENYDHEYITNLKPVYRFVFELLKLRGLTCVYETLDANVFKSFMGELERMVAIVQVEQVLAQKTELSEKQKLRKDAKMQKANEAFKASNDKIPVKIQAYYEVYGCWPQGYPPEVENDTDNDIC